MSEQNKELNNLLNPTSAQLREEYEMAQQGLMPERWLQIEAAETQRMYTAMEQALQERMKNWTEGEFLQRQAKLRIYFGDLMQPPSFAVGPYAAERWMNLYEMLPRIIDIKQDEAIVPDVDGRVLFSSLGLDKRTIIGHWLVNKVQAALPKDERLTDAHLNYCFTNVTEIQLTILIDQIAQSGLTLMSESPMEHWRKIVAKSTI